MWVRDLLLDKHTAIADYFDNGSIEHLLSENARTQRYAKEVFSLITLELWHRIFVSGKRTVLGGRPQFTIRNGSTQPKADTISPGCVSNPCQTRVSRIGGQA